MSERVFPIERIIAQKRYAAHAQQDLRDVQKNFLDQTGENFPYSERKKTEKEEIILRAIDTYTNDRLVYDGVAPISITSDHVHIVPDEAVAGLTTSESNRNAYAAYMPYHQSILISESEGLVEFAVRAYHEMTHFKSFQSLQIPKDDNSQLADYRIGFIIRSRDMGSLYFSNLNEAITDELAKRFLIGHVKDIPVLREEHEAEQEKAQVLRDMGIEIKLDEVLFVESIDEKSDNTPVSLSMMNYNDQRYALNTLIDKLYERNIEQFTHREDVFDIFARGANSGHIIEVARLVEHTFGKGAFRKLGELDQDVEALKAYVDSL